MTPKLKMSTVDHHEDQDLTHRNMFNILRYLAAFQAESFSSEFIIRFEINEDSTIRYQKL